jgi:hypothetical protein
LSFCTTNLDVVVIESHFCSIIDLRDMTIGSK